MQSCALRDLCKEEKSKYGCEDDSATCHLMAEWDAETRKYVPKSFCSCPSTSIVLPNRKRSCTNSCTGYCLHGDCAVDINSGATLCQCEKGFTGLRCNTTETAAAPSSSGRVSTGFKTATIIFSVLISLALLGVIYVLVKK